MAAYSTSVALSDVEPAERNGLVTDVGLVRSTLRSTGVGSALVASVNVWGPVDDAGLVIPDQTTFTWSPGLMAIGTP